MHFQSSVAFVLLVSTVIQASPDRFNYDVTKGNDYGPKDWGSVGCDNVATCPGWPTNWEVFNPFIPYDGASNTCKDCSVSTTGECRLHGQSPINLYRSVVFERTCHDRHRMHFVKGNCSFEELDFQILPHALRVYQPKHCVETPNIDFSMGFPNPWLLDFTDISVPSQHVQNGKQYDAEVVLSHTYSVDKLTHLIGNVAIFLERGGPTDYYDFLDIYIRRWKETEAAVKSHCQRRLRAPRNETTALGGGYSPVPQRLLQSAISPDVELGRTFHPYDFYKMTKTEYYFRYEGSTLVPPCFETVHWRVLKDPIKVSPQQIIDIESLLANRVDPNTCKKYTAGKPIGSNAVDVNRPIQTNSGGHKLVFCECINWMSRSKDDQAWCNLTYNERLDLESSQSPSLEPSLDPSRQPSHMPSDYPTSTPSKDPSPTPTSLPTYYPSSPPIILPVPTFAAKETLKPSIETVSTSGFSGVSSDERVSSKARIAILVAMVCILITVGTIIIARVIMKRKMRDGNLQ